jgi:nitrite reductase/ring-hydroxylating ferredoxin subunit
MKFAWVLAFVAVFFLSCGKNSDPVPNVSVYFQGSLLSTQLHTLRGVNEAVNIPGGVAGIVIYHRADNVYVAYDRCSSYKPENKCAVTIDSDNLTVTDPCSGSIFSLYDGNPVKAPASVALKSYSVALSGDGYTITVSN